MPELPEVETVKNGLNHFLQYPSTITKIWKSNFKLRFSYPQKLISYLQGQKIKSVTRRAKYLLFHMEEHILIVHLGMTGHWRKEIHFQKQKQKHDHFALQINDQFWLVYNDPRRFGFVDLISHSEIHTAKWFEHLAPEPFDVQNFNAVNLYKKIHVKSKNIKTALMDQTLVVGVGNIYASEVLFRCKIHPQTLCKKLKLKHCEDLVCQIRSVLHEAIESGGSTIRDFKQAGGYGGEFQQKLKVYGRTGESCVVCKSKIKKQIIGTRSSFFCPQCQK